MGDLACRQPAGGPSISLSSACWSGGGAGGRRLGNRERRIATHSKARLPNMTVCLLAPFFLQSSRRLALLFAFSHSYLIFRGETLRARSVVALCITPAWFSFSWVFFRDSYNVLTEMANWWLKFSVSQCVYLPMTNDLVSCKQWCPAGWLDKRTMLAH